MTQAARALLARYPVGTRIRLITMVDEPHPVPSGTLGTVTGVDDLPSLFVQWDNGRTLKILPDIDSFAVLPTSDNRHAEIDWGPPEGREVW